MISPSKNKEEKEELVSDVETREVKFEDLESNTENGVSENDDSERYMRYRVFSKTANSHRKNKNKSKKSLIENENSDINKAKLERTLIDEDESVTLVNKKNEGSTNSKKRANVIEESSADHLLTETFVDDDSINEENLENKKEFIEKNDEYIVLSDSSNNRKKKGKEVESVEAREVEVNKVNKRKAGHKGITGYILGYIMSIMLYVFRILKLTGKGNIKFIRDGTNKRNIKLIKNEKGKQEGEEQEIRRN
ncbi:hypothetical protein U3516DRAFT_658403 [Neocallimastix sp. 'constans']